MTPTSGYEPGVVGKYTRVSRVVPAAGTAPASQLEIGIGPRSSGRCAETGAARRSAKRNVIVRVMPGRLSILPARRNGAPARGAEYAHGALANIGYIQVVRHCNHFCGFCSNPA